MPTPERVSLVTGAASGIGLETARRLARKGDRLVLIDRNSDGLKKAAFGIAGHKPLACAIDVGDRAAVETAVQQAIDQFGQLDVVLNLAAVVDNWGAPADLSERLWDDVLKVNLRGVVHTCNAAIPHMQRGAVVNAASVCGVLRACASRSPYNAAKAALVAFTRDLAAAYGPQGIRANVVVPGFIDTPMSRRLIVGNEEQAEAERQRIPLRRAGCPEEVAAVCAFLASEEATYVTGSIVTVDGGISIV
jgi:NAD(P)-dependent dehydrogenase (short-subunit alcohol dehydrogenase family)